MLVTRGTEYIITLRAIGDMVVIKDLPDMSDGSPQYGRILASKTSQEVEGDWDKDDNMFPIVRISTFYTIQLVDAEGDYEDKAYITREEDQLETA